VASCPPGHGAWLHPPVRRLRQLLIRWRWTVVPPMEGEVDAQPANDVIEEGEFQRQREEGAEHHEALYSEASSGEWEEERSSSSLQLRSASPKSPLVIPDSPSARAYLIFFNLVPLPTPCYPYQELSYTYSRMICSSLPILAFPGAGSSLSSPPSPTVGNHHNIQGVTHNTALTPTHHANTQSCTQRLVLQVMKTIASPPASLVLCFTARRAFARSPLVYWKQPSEPAITQAHPYEALVRRPFYFFSTPSGPFTM